jgi:methylmalonyl-CoA/ethylmalonyl-CoA epimerase
MAIESVLKVGIAVKDLDEAYRLFTEVLGLTPGGIGPFEPVGMRGALCHLDDFSVELMEPLRPGGPIAKFIEKHGEGLQHISLKVPNIEEAISQLKKKGIEFIQETPLEGEYRSRRARSVFVNPRSFHGVPVQLVELS